MHAHHEEGRETVKQHVWVFIVMLLLFVPGSSWSEERYATITYQGVKTGLVMTDYGRSTYELVEDSASLYKKHTLIGLVSVLDLPMENLDQKLLDCFSAAGRAGAYVRLTGTIQRTESDGSEGFTEITNCSVVTER